MVLPVSPDRPSRNWPTPRRVRPARAPVFISPDAKDMISLLISAVAGALATGAIATLIIMSAPAYAETPRTDGVGTSAGEESDAPEQLFPARVAPDDDLALIPFSGPRGLELPPVCTCILPQIIPD